MKSTKKRYKPILNHFQGAIVTRSSGKAVNVVRLRQPATRWFLLQTNYDNWTPTPFYDKRREAGDHCMAQVRGPAALVINTMSYLFE